MSESFPLVRPRIISEISGEHLLLDDVLEPFLRSDRPGVICIRGEPGAGKSAALKHLASQIPRATVAEILDAPDPARVTELSDRMLVIYTAVEPADVRHLAVLRLAPWGEDECLEYLMVAGCSKQRCASVLQRIRATPGLDAPETPELWRICLDGMAADERLGCEEALRRHLDERVHGTLREQARELSFEKLVLPSLGSFDEVKLYGHSGFLGFLMGRGLSAEDIRLLRNKQVRMLLAVERLVGGDGGEFYGEALERRLPPEMIVKAGRAVARKHRAVDALRSYVCRRQSQPMAASLLNAAMLGWKPDPNIQRFKDAYLPRADWTEVTIADACFEDADLTEAHFRYSTLDHATFRNARLRRADLRACRLARVDARNADLTGADLSLASAANADFSGAELREARFAVSGLQGARFIGADLRGASFLQANLEGAIFQTQAKNFFNDIKEIGLALGPVQPEAPTRFDGVDFTSANLEGARLVGADLRDALLAGARFGRAALDSANLEGIEVPGAPFDEADLRAALLTGSVLTGASFRKAKLRYAKLADIQWENADLREADLGGATFHMGSSRSGLVFGDPSEGTRNGFYTDDYNDQSFRAPEEIRSANLRGADLRGANLEGTDFYLVDLRDARITPDQENWLRRCGAILESRV
jgi:uncharacterized protein YjbI with pentapeptide repeats